MKKIHAKTSFNYAIGSKGFQSWCGDINTRYWQEEHKFYPDEIKHLIEKVPCHAELYRYISFHNNAFSLGEKYKSDKATQILY